VVEVRPLIDLETHEDESQEKGHNHPEDSGLSFFDGLFCCMIREAAANEEKRGDKGLDPWQLHIAFAGGPGMTRLPGKSIFRPPQDKIPPEQSCKKHGLGGEENDHSKLAGSRRGLGVASVVTVRLVGKNGGAHLGKIKG
jgi:hypothetical protein